MDVLLGVRHPIVLNIIGVVFLILQAANISTNTLSVPQQRGVRT